MRLEVIETPEVFSRSSAFDELNPCFLGRLDEIEVFCIPNSRDFFKNHFELGRNLLSQCTLVQDKVWQKRNSTYHNSFGAGNLVLFIRNQIVKGFGSASAYSSEGAGFIHYSDMMFEPEIRRKGLASVGLAALQLAVLQEHSLWTRAYSIVASGNIAPFKLFECSGAFSPVQSSALCDVELTTLQSILAMEFPQGVEAKNNIIKNAWAEQQQPENDVWPRALTQSWNFPTSVQYAQGEVFLKLYCLLRRNIPMLRQLLCKRLDDVAY